MNTKFKLGKLGTDWRIILSSICFGAVTVSRNLRS